MNETERPILCWMKQNQMRWDSWVKWGVVKEGKMNEWVRSILCWMKQNQMRWDRWVK